MILRHVWIKNNDIISTIILSRRLNLANFLNHDMSKIKTVLLDQEY